MRRFLHLSDIHFNASPGEPARDVDLAVRRDLLEDLRGLKDTVRPVDAVLVVGDLTAHGTAEQFVLAREFLDEACTIVDCDPTHIACVPGNHDIHRKAHGPLHDGLRRLLRTIPIGEISTRIEQILTDPAAAEIIHRPLEHYNRFALPLGWAFTDEHPIPGAWDLDLNGHTLRIRGVNSALICDKTDAYLYDRTRVALGTGQLAQLSEDRGRAGCCQPPPAQIPAYGITILGSCLGYERRSERRARGAGCVRSVAIVQRGVSSAPRSTGHAGCGAVALCANAW